MADRRSFLKGLGGVTVTTLVLTEMPRLAVSGGLGGGSQPCSYGTGLYGAGLYSGSLSASAPAILADRASNDLLLTWSGAPLGTSYEVWRSDQPFRPGDPGSTLLATVAGTSYVDSGALADSTDYYYVVRGLLDCS